MHIIEGQIYFRMNVWKNSAYSLARTYSIVNFNTRYDIFFLMIFFSDGSFSNTEFTELDNSFGIVL